MDDATTAALLFDRFHGRRSAYTVQHPTNFAYHPVRDHAQIDVPLTPDLLARHVQGEETIGYYLIREEDSAVKTICLDVDINKDDLAGAEGRMQVRDLAAALVAVADAHHLSPLIEDSGNKGYHLWWFLSGWVPAGVAKLFGDALVHQVALSQYPACHVEVFPKQAVVEPGKYGNLVKMPLGVHRKTGNRSWFLNPADWQPYPPESQASVLDGTAWTTPVQVYALAEDAATIEMPPPGPETHLATDGIARMVARCQTIRAIVEEAAAGGAVNHEKRLILMTLGKNLGEAGVAWIHQVLSTTPNYDAAKTQSYLDQYTGKPMSCQQICARTQSTACTCPVATTPGRLPSPIRYAFEKTPMTLARVTDHARDALALPETTRGAALDQLIPMLQALSPLERAEFLDKAAPEVGLSPRQVKHLDHTLGDGAERSQNVGEQLRRWIEEAVRGQYLMVGYTNTKVGTTMRLFNKSSRSDIYLMLDSTTRIQSALAPALGSLWDTLQAAHDIPHKYQLLFGDMVRRVMLDMTMGAPRLESMPTVAQGVHLMDSGRIYWVNGSQAWVQDVEAGPWAVVKGTSDRGVMIEYAQKRWSALESPQAAPQYTAQEVFEFCDAALRIGWTFSHPIEGTLLALLCLLAPVSSAFRRQPFVHVLGPQGCGKSRVVKGWLAGYHGEGSYFPGMVENVVFQTSATRFALAAKYANESKLFCLDEFEPDAHALQILDMFRSSMDSTSGLIRGTSSGEVKSYLLRCPVIFASVSGMRRDADASRMLVINCRKEEQHEPPEVLVQPLLASVDMDAMRTSNTLAFLPYMRQLRQCEAEMTYETLPGQQGVDARSTENVRPFLVIAKMLGLDYQYIAEHLFTSATEDYETQKETQREVMLLKAILDTPVSAPPEVQRLFGQQTVQRATLRQVLAKQQEISIPTWGVQVSPAVGAGEVYLNLSTVRPVFLRNDPVFATMESREMFQLMARLQECYLWTKMRYMAGMPNVRTVGLSLYAIVPGPRVVEAPPVPAADDALVQVAW